MKLAIQLAPAAAFCFFTTVASAQQQPQFGARPAAAAAAQRGARAAGLRPQAHRAAGVAHEQEAAHLAPVHEAAHGNGPHGAVAYVAHGQHGEAHAGAPHGAAPAQGIEQHAGDHHAAAPAKEASVVRTEALKWAADRNLPVREIEVGPADRRVTRVFLPVTKEQWPDFVKTFSSGPNRLMLKLKGRDNHLMPVIDKAAILWARDVKAFGGESWYGMEAEGHHDPSGPAMIVELDKSESDHVRQWFTHRADGMDSLWGQSCGHACMDFIGNIEVASAKDGTNTLRAIPRDEVEKHAGNDRYGVKGGMSTKVPMGKKLFDVLGIARSKDGKNMTYNMIHAANEKVQVVGIPVGSDEGGMTEKRVIRENGRVFVRDVALGGKAIERFNNMTDEQLLGPLPPQGVDGVARPVK